MSTTAPMTPPQARLELALWQADAHSVSNADIYARLTDMGLPPEVAIRLKALMEVLRRR